LLWQISYAELWVTEKYWPDFDAATLREALAAFAGRERRFGGATTLRPAPGITPFPPARPRVSHPALGPRPPCRRGPPPYARGRRPGWGRRPRPAVPVPVRLRAGRRGIPPRRTAGPASGRPPPQGRRGDLRRARPPGREPVGRDRPRSGVPVGASPVRLPCRRN